MPNQEKIDSLFDIALIEVEKTKTLALLDEVNTRINKISRVEIQLKGESSIKGIKDSVAGLNAEQKELLRINNEIEKTYAKRIALESQQAKILAEEKKLLADRNQELKNTVREENAVTGSTERLRAELIRLQKTYDNLAPQERSSEAGLKLQKNTAALTAELKVLEGQTGRTQRNVGNYNEGIKQVEVISEDAVKKTKAFSEEVGKTEPKADAAAKGVSKFFGGLKSLANIIPGLGLSGLLVVGFELISTAASAAASALGLFSSKTYSAKKAAEEINDEFKNTSVTVADAKTKLEVLTARTQQAGLTFQDKKSILKSYNAEFGDTIGLAKNYNDLEKILVDRAPVYIQILTLKAKAQAAANLQQKELQKQLSGDLENTDLFGLIIKNPLGDIEDLAKGIIEIDKKTTAKVEAYAKQQADFERQADALKLKYHINTEDDKTAKTAKSSSDRTKEILAEARKQAFELQKIREQEAIDEAGRNGNNKDNLFDQRAVAFMQEFDLKRDLLKKETAFEVQEVKNALALELAQNKYSASEIKALKEKAAADIAVIREKNNSEEIKNAAELIDKIKAVDAERLSLQETIHNAYREAELRFQNNLADAALKIQKKALDEAAKAKKKHDDEEEKNKKARIEKLKELEKEGIDTIAAFVDASFERQKRQIEDQITAIGKKKDKDLEAINAATLSEQEKATRITQINLKAQADSEALAEKQRALDIKKAQFDKAVSIAHIIQNTAQGITAALASLPPNPGLAILVGAIGALQLAKAIATPIPKFAEGTDNAPGGIAMVGEKGSELIVAPSGDVSLTPSNATLMHLQKGSKVITADKVDQYLMNTAVKKMNIPTGINEVNYSQEMTQAITSELKRIGGIIESKQENHFHWDNGELRKAIKKGKQWTEWVNNYKS